MSRKSRQVRQPSLSSFLIISKEKIFLIRNNFKSNSTMKSQKKKIDIDCKPKSKNWFDLKLNPKIKQ
jgi:hypothetical protein